MAIAKVTELSLATRRLVLRTPRVEDASSLQVIAEDGRVALTTASIPHPYPEDGAMDFIQHIRANIGGGGIQLGMVLKEDHEFIGMVGYRADDGEAELAYMVSPRHWAKGYATEAVEEIVRHTFEHHQFSAVTARTMADNKASEKVLSRVGLRRQYEAPVELPLRHGTFITSFWRLDRGDYATARVDGRH